LSIQRKKVGKKYVGAATVSPFRGAANPHMYRRNTHWLYVRNIVPVCEVMCNVMPSIKVIFVLYIAPVLDLLLWSATTLKCVFISGIVIALLLHYHTTTLLVASIYYKVE
jgi:hypothetical protein